jgi:hypothetical protein
VLNILIQPEYGKDWIVDEVLRDVPKDEITDELVEQVDDLITARLRALAASVVVELPAEKRAEFNLLSE